MQKHHLTTHGKCGNRKESETGVTSVIPVELAGVEMMCQDSWEGVAVRHLDWWRAPSAM